MIRALSLSLRASTSRIRVPSLPFAGKFSTDAGADAGASGPRLFVVQPRLRPESALRAKLEEAVCLASSLEEQRDEFSGVAAEMEVPQHIIVQNPAARGHRAHADKFFGPGTVETIKIQLNHVESKGEVDAVFVNTTLSGVQQRNLERTWGKPVLDRVSLIIEIFNAHANTREGKLQAELAALMYKKTRLVRVRDTDGRLTFGAEGEVEVVSARGRGSGGRGFLGGAGETEIQLQRRRIAERRRLLLSQIEEVRRTRALQRASRKRHGGSDGRGLATVAIVGYTNAGKSTLVSALSDSPLYSDSRLFATVDPRLRNVVLPSGKKILLSDTVGFISDLPVQLVEAFHATLEEVVEADLLVHVLDSTAANLDEHRSTVLSVLEQIGVSKEKLENMIEVWNKIDRQEPQDKILDDGEVSNISGEDEQDHDHLDDDLDLVEDEQDHDHSENNLDLVEDEQDHDHYDDDLVVDDDEQDHYHLDEVFDSENGRNVRMDNTSENVDNISALTSGPDGKKHELTSGPDVKTSALTSVGLQELLELIDGRLREQDEKFKAENVVQRNVFGRKWRPNRDEETDIAV